MNPNNTKSSTVFHVILGGLLGGMFGSFIGIISNHFIYQIQWSELGNIKTLYYGSLLGAVIFGFSKASFEIIYDIVYGITTNPFKTGVKGLKSGALFGVIFGIFLGSMYFQANGQQIITSWLMATIGSIIGAILGFTGNQTPIDTASINLEGIIIQNPLQKDIQKDYVENLESIIPHVPAPEQDVYISYVSLETSSETPTSNSQNKSEVKNLDEFSKAGMDYLMLAIFEGFTDTAKKLIHTEQYLKEQDKFGKTALMFAAEKGYTEIAQLLIEKAKPFDLVNIQNKHGDTALNYATERGYADFVQLLLNSGANRNLKNIDNMSTLDIALKKNHSSIVELLKE